jgi:SAM-dependent methyltransferase
VLSQTKHFSQEAKDKRPGEHIHFMVADGRRLPFADKSVREVFLSNILNADADVDDDVRQQLLGEAHRVLEKDGYLVVRVNWNRDDWHVEDMDKALDEHNFGTVRTVRAEDPEYARLEAQYGTPGEVIAPEGYYLIARRNSNVRSRVGLLEQLLGKEEAERAMAHNEQMLQEMQARVRQVYKTLGAKAVDQDAFGKEYMRLVKEEHTQARTKTDPKQ